MKRLPPFLLLVVTIGLCGCQCGRRQAQDPFFGRTTVPPPPTGTLSGAPGDPAYSNAPEPITDQPITPDGPAWRVRPGATQPGNSRNAPSQPLNSQPTTNSGNTPRYVPPGGGYQYQGSTLPKAETPTLATRVPPPTFAEATTTANADGDAEAAVGRVALNPRGSTSLAGRERVIRILQPRPEPADEQPATTTADANLDSSAEQPRVAEKPDEAVDIMDLPRVR